MDILEKEAPVLDYHKSYANFCFPQLKIFLYLSSQVCPRVDTPCSRVVFLLFVKMDLFLVFFATS